MDNRCKEMLNIAYKALDDKKGIDIKAIDISDVCIFADCFLIASGGSASQIHAMADEVDEKLQKAGFMSKQVEGYDKANWILADYGDLIIHIFDKESRDFYDLERLWKDGKEIAL